MNKKHAKSPCCSAPVIGFGERRRQCRKCFTTWRIRKKKRGRKSRRTGAELVIRYLRHEIPSTYALARRRGTSPDRFDKYLKQSRDFFCAHTPWPEIPENRPLIAIADAMVRQIEKRWHTIYFILLRSTQDENAVVSPPYIRRGTETAAGWEEAFGALDQNVRNRIHALVSDGHRGLVYVARWHGWIHQRCHFHLIARIQSRRSKWAWSQHREEGKKIYDLVSRVLTTRDESEILPILITLEELGWQTSSRDLKNTIRGFVTHWEDFRSYLRHPELNLPTTSNTAEALIGLVRNLMHRARGFRTIASSLAWIEALLKEKHTIRCRGNYQPKKSG